MERLSMRTTDKLSRKDIVVYYWDNFKSDLKGLMSDVMADIIIAVGRFI